MPVNSSIISANRSDMAKAFPSVASLIEQKAQLIAYLLSKVQAEDWHAVMDSAADLREIEVQLELLTPNG